MDKSKSHESTTNYGKIYVDSDEQSNENTNENMLMSWLLKKTNWTNHRCNEIVHVLPNDDNLQIQDLSEYGLRIDEIQEITTLLQREQVIIHIKQITRENTKQEQRRAINNLLLEIVYEARDVDIDSFNSWSQPFEENDIAEKIDLKAKRLKGNIPSLIGYIPNLTYLDLSNNKLRGEIPSSLGNLTHLAHLTFHVNLLSGDIPLTIGNLTNLTYLNLSYNQLRGEIPSSLGNLTNINHIFLDNNQLSGEIPSSLGNLTNINHIFPITN